TFDVVIAGYALHVAKDLTEAMRRIRRLLADGGHLLALEYHDTEILAPCFGLLDSFWGFTDTELRSCSPLLTREQWPPVLRSAGFDEVVQLGYDEDYSVILAGRPARSGAQLAPTVERTGSTWVLLAEESDAAIVNALSAILTEAGHSVTRATF